MLLAHQADQVVQPVPPAPLAQQDQLDLQVRQVWDLLAQLGPLVHLAARPEQLARPEPLGQLDHQEVQRAPLARLV